MMTPEEQRIAIAEWCGCSVDKSGYWSDENGQYFKNGVPPDYCSDLNAMYQAEKALDTTPVDVRSLWLDNLAVCCDWPETKNALELKFEVQYITARATAAQRAEALCRTLWPERFTT